MGSAAWAPLQRPVSGPLAEDTRVRVDVGANSWPVAGEHALVAILGLTADEAETVNLC